jgi:hypothetical protein
LPIKVPSLPGPVGFVTVKDRMLTPLAERFIECARNVANSDTGRATTRHRKCRLLARSGAYRIAIKCPLLGE